jgi:hypothetical protein
MLTPSLTPDSNQPPLQLSGSSQSPTHMKCISEKLLLGCYSETGVHIVIDRNFVFLWHRHNCFLR